MFCVIPSELHLTGDRYQFSWIGLSTRLWLGGPFRKTFGAGLDIGSMSHFEIMDNSAHALIEDVLSRFNK